MTATSPDGAPSHISKRKKWIKIEAVMEANQHSLHTSSSPTRHSKSLITKLMIQTSGMYEGIVKRKNFLCIILRVYCYLLFLNLISQIGKLRSFMFTKSLKKLEFHLALCRQDIVKFFMPGLNMDVSFWFSKKTCTALTHWVSDNEKLLA